MNIGALAACGLALGLAACASSSDRLDRSDYDIVQRDLRNNPQVYRREVQRCIASSSRDSHAERTALGNELGTSAARAPQAFCTRMYRGIASGRVSYSEFIAATNGHFTPNMVRVLRGG